jgi:hypothetical protein
MLGSHEHSSLRRDSTGKPRHAATGIPCEYKGFRPSDGSLAASAAALEHGDLANLQGLLHGDRSLNSVRDGITAREVTFVRLLHE